MLEKAFVAVLCNEFFAILVILYLWVRKDPNLCWVLVLNHKKLPHFRVMRVYIDKGGKISQRGKKCPCSPKCVHTHHYRNISTNLPPSISYSSSQRVDFRESSGHSSFEILQDAFGDENQLPIPLWKSIVATAKLPSGWKKGATIP